MPASRPYGHTARLSCAALGGSLLLALSACGSDQEAIADAASLDSSSQCEPEDGPLRIYVNDWGEAIPEGFTEHTGVLRAAIFD